MLPEKTKETLKKIVYSMRLQLDDFYRITENCDHRYGEQRVQEINHGVQYPICAFNQHGAIRCHPENCSLIREK